jgi:hypothetical protein
LDSFSWPAKQANPRDGVSTPAASPQNIKTTFSGGFCVFGTLSDLNAPFDHQFAGSIFGQL